jgi:hypothetical protein
VMVLRFPRVGCSRLDALFYLSWQTRPMLTHSQRDSEISPLTKEKQDAAMFLLADMFRQLQVE